MRSPRRLPGGQEFVDDRVQLLLRRFPRLEQIPVDVDHVDRLDRSIGVRVRGQQRPASEREEIHRLFEELDAVHVRHPVVGQERRDRPPAAQDLLERIERVRAGVGAHDAVRSSVAPSQVPGHGSGDGGIVVDGKEHGEGYAAALGGGRGQDLVRRRFGGSAHAPTSSTKHQRQDSPGSYEVITGSRVCWKWTLACLFGEESQQPMCPQLRQRRRCTHWLPVARHSWQPCGVNAGGSAVPSVRIRFDGLMHPGNKR